MASSPQYVFPTTQCTADAVAFRYQDCWDPPALTYSGASSPASSISSPSTSPSTPGSIVESEPYISEPGTPRSESVQQQAQGHIPRPRNAFIIFRSFYYAQARGAQNENNSINQNALSCAAAAAWKALTEDEKKTFRRQAEEEKLMHYKKHPNYVYTPLNRAVKRAQKKTSKATSKSQPTKKRHRSSLSQRSCKAESRRRISRSSSSMPDNSASRFVLLDDIPHLELALDEKCCDDSKTDGESQKRVDLQFGQRPDVTFTQLPPTPTDTRTPEPTLYSSPPITSQKLPISSDIPPYHNLGYPNWMYNELLGYGAPDTGLHAGWNPLQTTLNSYGDNYFNHDQPSDDHDDFDFSLYLNYDDVDTGTTANDYSFKETTGDATSSHPFLSQDGNYVGA